jgi:Holliday junction DNA helicase RuvA
MIGFLEGKVLEKKGGQATILVNGVGYRVSLPFSVFEKLSEGSTAKLYTYLAVRENALDLYGFTESGDKALFELLLTVSGIGPKTALGVMNTASAMQIEKAVVEQNPSYLTKVVGVGKKVSEKIVMELKGKIMANSKENSLGDVDGDVVEALVSLGYSQNEKIKFALKNLSPKKK